MTADVTLTGAVNNAQKTQQQQVQLTKDFSQFLTLLTTQLQNQDPMNPMDSNEFTNQLVQFSQVEQAINTNQKLDNLVNLQLSGMSGVALGYVGMDVMYRSADMNYDGENPVSVIYALNEQAKTAKINVFDEQGNLVYNGDAPKDAGRNEFVWEGVDLLNNPVEPGTYTVRIDAFDFDDKIMDTSTVVSGRVRGIESQDGVIFLLVGERAVALGNVINATSPPPPQQPPDQGGGA